MNASLGASLIRSLFCGLKEVKNRLAVFVSASDETIGGGRNGMFHICGLVAPEADWSQYFAPAWEERVLNGPPKIPYLHMTEIRSRSWRSLYGISQIEAENRVDEACSIIGALGSIFPARATVHLGKFSKVVQGKKVRVSTGGVKRLEPDYLCFLGYAYLILRHIAEAYSDVHKVDFVVERKLDVTEHLRDFYKDFPSILNELGDTKYASLIGELIPASTQDRIPLQAADVLCWHTQRAHLGTLSTVDKRRYRRIGSKGWSHNWSDRNLALFRDALSKGLLNETSDRV